MSAPPGTALYNWQIGLGATFTNGTQITGWVDQASSKVMNQGGTGSNNSYSTSTGLISLPQNTFWAPVAITSLSQPYTVCALLSLNGNAGNFPYFVKDAASMQGFWNSGTSLGIGNGSTMTWTTADISSGNHTVIAVYNGTSSKLYIDGTDQGAASSGTTVGTGQIVNSVEPMGGTNPNAAGLHMGSFLIYADFIGGTGALNGVTSAQIDTWLKAQPGTAGNIILPPGSKMDGGMQSLTGGMRG